MQDDISFYVKTEKIHNTEKKKISFFFTRNVDVCLRGAPTGRGYLGQCFEILKQESYIDT